LSCGEQGITAEREKDREIEREGDRGRDKIKRGWRRGVVE